MENNNENLTIYLTDSMSLKVIAAAIHDAELSYRRIVGNESIKKIFDQYKGQIISKIKRKGYAYGISKLTESEFPAVEPGKSTMVDIPYGGIVINVGISNPTQYDIDNLELWDKGLFDLELRILYIKDKK